MPQTTSASNESCETLPQSRSTSERAKKNLNRAIKASKAKLWQEICNDLDDDIWCNAYQIVTERLGKASPEGLKSPALMSSIVAE
ncbi:Protein of unknown function, partial [Cotesia congregata]